LEGKWKPRTKRVSLSWKRLVTLRTRRWSKALESRASLEGSRAWVAGNGSMRSRAGERGRNVRRARCRSDAVTATGEGTSSRGVSVSGTCGVFSSEGEVAQKRGEPHGRHGMQHSRKHGAEQAVEVVRDHEGGTTSGGWCRAGEDLLFGGSRVWTHRVENGGGATELAGGRKSRKVASVTGWSSRPRQAP
jgi:hypothetical protein